mgnify:CR=1 FL=1
MEMIKVSANSRTSAVAGAIAGVVREHKRAEVQAIGAGAAGIASLTSSLSAISMVFQIDIYRRLLVRGRPQVGFSPQRVAEALRRS